MKAAVWHGSRDVRSAELASHKIGTEDVPEAYEKFQKKEDGAIKFVIKP